MLFDPGDGCFFVFCYHFNSNLVGSCILILDTILMGCFSLNFDYTLTYGLFFLIYLLYMLIIYQYSEFYVILKHVYTHKIFVLKKLKRLLHYVKNLKFINEDNILRRLTNPTNSSTMAVGTPFAIWHKHVKITILFKRRVNCTIMPNGLCAKRGNLLIRVLSLLECSAILLVAWIGAGLTEAFLIHWLR